jgi:hypothetical protein
VKILRLSDNEEQHAQSIACTHLVRGCEDAVSELVLVNADTDGRSPTMDRAQDILAQVLSSWRGAREALRPAEAPGTVTTVVNNLNGWTSDELFAEAVERRAGDAPALRLMQSTILRALLTAHDGAISSTAQATLILR